jgi:hypothetical protein
VYNNSIFENIVQIEIRKIRKIRALCAPLEHPAPSGGLRGKRKMI